MIKLSEQKRIHLIEEFTKHKEEVEAIPGLEGFTYFMFETLMNEECLRCQTCKVNSGTCYGRIGVASCLIFRPNEWTVRVSLAREG